MTKALASLDRQTHTIDEIIVVDDGSDNDDWERLIEYWKHWESDTTLRIARIEDNPQKERSMRIPYVRNTGFKLLQGSPDYVFFADADDQWHIRYVEDAIAIMEKNSSIDFVYPEITIASFDDGNPVPQLRRHCFVPEFDQKRVFRQCYISYCSIMRTEAFLEVGMWPENHFKKEFVFWNVMVNLGHVGSPLRGEYFFYIQHPGQRHTENDGTGQEKHHKYNAQRFISETFHIY
jgi:glycosyltransferase involved in cell wall biosynthesis